MIKKIIILAFFFIMSLSFNSLFAGDSGDISKETFEISVGKLTSSGTGYIVEGDTKATLNTFLGNIIQKLMIGLGSLSLIIMTVGGGYMLIYHGQDELLSKGKYIFISGVISLVVALSSYYMVDGLRSILYLNN